MTTRGIAPNVGATLRKGVELELAFTDLLTNGQGVGRAGGLVLFCFGPLPQERARVRVTEVKQRYAVADLVEILQKSPARAQPFCPVFGACGGCQVQHLDYAAQLQWKRNVVRDALARIGALGSVEVRATIGMAHPRAYRNKMSLVVDHRYDPPAIGFYRQRSHEIVPIDACPIVTPQLNADLSRLDLARRAAPVSAMLRDARHLVARSAERDQEKSLDHYHGAAIGERRERRRRCCFASFPGLWALPTLSILRASMQSWAGVIARSAAKWRLRKRSAAWFIAFRLARSFRSTLKSSDAFSSTSSRGCSLPSAS